MKTYKTKAGAVQYKQTLKALERVAREENGGGFCLACGTDAAGVEPDARKCKCEGCGAPKVYGAEQLILMGLFY